MYTVLSGLLALGLMASVSGSSMPTKGVSVPGSKMLNNGRSSTLSSDNTELQKRDAWGPGGWQPISDKVQFYLPDYVFCDIVHDEIEGHPLYENYRHEAIQGALTGGYRLVEPGLHYGQNLKSQFMRDHNLDTHLYLEFEVTQQGYNVTLTKSSIRVDHTGQVLHDCTWGDDVNCCGVLFCPYC